MEYNFPQLPENNNSKSSLRLLLNLFLRGLLVVLPIALTIGILFWILGILGSVLHLSNLSFGAMILYVFSGIALITLIGKVTEGVVAQQVISFLEGVIEKAPGLSWIFGTTKDVTKAFVGKEKKFTKPVKVKVTDTSWRLGFLTQDSLDDLGLPDYCSVYLPFSFAITGQVIVAKKVDVTHLDVDSGALMKFIVSGGVTDIK